MFISKVVKHKETLKKIIENKLNKGEDRLNILTGKSELFEDENIDIHHVDLCEVYNMINKNEIEDAKTAIGILLAKELI